MEGSLSDWIVIEASIYGDDSKLQKDKDGRNSISFRDWCMPAFHRFPETVLPQFSTLYANAYLGQVS